MMFYSNKARRTTREQIQDIHAKIANMPLNSFPDGLADVQTIHFLLRTLDDALRKEIKENSN